MEILLWAVVPYVTLTLFAAGLVWRYRHDKLGWTTYSTQLFEQRLLRWGSPLFHFGVLATLLGHVGGILIPKRLTEVLGIPGGLFRGAAFGLGTLAGSCLVAGMAILLYRRLTVGPVSRSTTVNDKIMYVLLVMAVLPGLATTIVTNLAGHEHDYRETVAVWFRSVFALDPRTELIAGAPLGFQLHALAAWALIAFWPFTRLVHAFSVPVGYLTRPYIVYRSRAVGNGARGVPRGWEHGGWAEPSEDR